MVSLLEIAPISRRSHTSDPLVAISCAQLTISRALELQRAATRVTQLRLKQQADCY